MTMNQEASRVPGLAIVYDGKRELSSGHSSGVDAASSESSIRGSSQAERRSLKHVAGRVGLYAAVFAICIYSFFPVYWMILSSFRAPQKLFLDTSLVFWPPDFSSRLHFRGKTAMVASMLFAYMFPPLMLVIPMSAIFRAIGLTDSLWALLIAHMAISLPLAVWLLWGFFKTMPFELEEAAMVDGCSQFSAFIKVVLPLSAPGLITVGIFSFLLSWADYVFALILIMSDKNKTLPVALASMLGAQDLRWGELLAGATLIALPLFLLFTFCYRYFVAGLASGALKG